jgi:hypothetical protein
MEEIAKYYKEEVDRLTSEDFMIESLSRHCSASINLIDSITNKDSFSENTSAQDIKTLLASVANNINKLKQK